MNAIITTLLLSALAAATFTDLKSQRIPNWITFPLIIAGMAIHAWFDGMDGFLYSLGGFGIGFFVMAIPYFLGVMGAGDVKLMAGVGACLGTAGAFTAFLFTCLAGGVYALVILLRDIEFLKAVFGNIRNSLYVFLSSRCFEYTPVQDTRALPRLCYGVAIAAGTVATLALGLAEAGCQPFGG